MPVHLTEDDIANGDVPKFRTGTYTGDGTTSFAVTGLGFQPRYVRVWKREPLDATIITVFETTTEIVDDHASGMSILIVGGDPARAVTAIDAIISLDADGFTVDDQGADRDPNTSGQVYNYLAIGA